MKLLVAEDDRVFQVMLGRTLRKWGYDTTIAEDGEKAWTQLSAEGGPRLAILDWVMPRLDGLEVCRRVRGANLPHYVYIILLTGKTNAADIVTGLEAGADDYLPKPVDPNELRLRLRAGSRVLQSEERHRIVAETASDGIVMMEHDHKIRFANRAAGAIFGYPPAGLVGREFSELAPGFERYLAGGPAAPSYSDMARLRSWQPIEIPGLYNGGREILLEVSFSESLDSYQQRILTAVIRDVTERKLVEGQRAQALKLESIGQLAAGVAHEINNPIQYIGDNLRFVEQSYASLQELLDTHRAALDAAKAGRFNSEVAAEVDGAAAAIDFDYLRQETPRAIDAALEGVERVAQIVKAMKEFSHPGSVDMAAADLNHLIETTALISRNAWKYAANLTTDLAADLPPVECVAGELSQVFLNLIVNAADAIGDCLKERQGKKGLITISTRQAGDWVEVRVTDTGTGIPPAVRSKIFDPFFTTKDVGRGSGQGLAIAYATVVRKHNGTIEFDTAMGTGTTFIVKLPIQASRENGIQEGETELAPADIF